MRSHGQKSMSVANGEKQILKRNNKSRLVYIIVSFIFMGDDDDFRNNIIELLSGKNHYKNWISKIH